MKQYAEHITDLKEALYRKEKFEEICEKLTDKAEVYATACDIYTTDPADIMDSLDETIPRYVEDFFGGKVIKQESNPVTILDRSGKATYGVTKKALPKGQKYHLIQDKN